MRKSKSSLSLYSLSSKSEKPFEKRYLENKFLRNKFPDDVPIVVILVKGLKDISTHKLLIPKQTSTSSILEVIGTSIGVSIDKAVTNIERGDKVYPLQDKGKDGHRMEDLYREYKDNDGFVYLTCDLSQPLPPKKLI